MTKLMVDKNIYTVGVYSHRDQRYYYLANSLKLCRPGAQSWTNEKPETLCMDYVTARALQHLFDGSMVLQIVPN